ncbi:hypothetical protein VTN49DRAFT_2126 [Thermomyces lanuginosus]|uniref:uncharacterized protein n=1 Tax=Thermomyces lanuginosus TaxID=5541 RepID=UPI00374448DD
MTAVLKESTSVLDSDPGFALRLAQQAPSFLAKKSTSLPFSLGSSDNAERWLTCERLFLACLRVGDDEAAQQLLDRLTERFGPANERVMGLKGLYQEATAKDARSLEAVLSEYDNILAENPVNVPIHKRRVAILRSLGREEDAISALVEFLEAFPTDTEAWCELAELYHSQGMSAQAIFSLEEALLVAPNSWNLHARLGELLYISTSGTEATGQNSENLARSIRHFCRSLELCDDYPRGLYGLIKATSRYLGYPPNDQVPSPDVIERLNRMAREKAQKLLDMRQSQDPDQPELKALQELLQRESGSADRGT